jgi:hypothetical protein
MKYYVMGGDRVLEVLDEKPTPKQLRTDAQFYRHDVRVIAGELLDMRSAYIPQGRLIKCPKCPEHKALFYPDTAVIRCDECGLMDLSDQAERPD